MNTLKFVFGHRGLPNLVKRSAQIMTRFGVSPEKMGRRFERFMDVLDEFSVRPTFPITALPLSRNPRFAHRLVSRGAELAVHAWSHIDLSALDYAGQKQHMGNAIQLFRDNGVPFTGFRAPYLHWNDDTMQVVADFGYGYSSNQTIWWDVISEDGLTPVQREGLERGVAFYQPIPASQIRSLPFMHHGFVEIPVSLPDDEIPHDRMYIRDAEYLRQMWTAILDQTYARGELFTVQLHPERIDFFSDALRAVLRDARSRRPRVWIATLDEIARWWVDRAGNRATFVRDGDGYHVTVHACDGTSLFVRDGDRERVMDAGDVFVPGTRRPCVGVLPGSSPGAIRVLTDLGYVVEPGERTDDYAVHLGRVEDAGFDAIAALRRAIAASPHPLVRFGTWPHGSQSAMSVTGDIDALTIWDFFYRFRGA